ncbi:hypothetical protein [Methylobacterium sp. C1]|uniref:hypothetical protein n=1 Tax=Methylobacterium sp. C1 TaxID=1479019 RepID=UPI001331249C|nr:hypothetical protein [Methylobacterium sp. C1]
MTRETKTQAEIESMLLEQIKTLPNGRYVEDVTLEFGLTESGHPVVGVGYIENDGDMRQILQRAITLNEQYWREYDVQPD